MTDHDPDGTPKGGVKRLEIKIDDAVATGAYSNLAMVHQTDSEMVLDFLFLHPGQPKATLRARVVTSPRHVKRLIAVLQEQMARYERLHGEVKLPKPPEGLVH
jgi:hypothetical protein